MNSKRIALLVFVVSLLLSSLACSLLSPINASEPEQPKPAADATGGSTVIFQEDFVNLEGWKINYDGHVDQVCPNITTTKADISVVSKNLPGLSVDGDDFVGQLTANSTGRPGQFASVIASNPLYNDISLVEDGTYVVGGYVAGVKGTELELVDVSMEIVTMEDGKPTAYYGELFLYLNSWLQERQKWQLLEDHDLFLRRHNGMVYTRTGPDDVDIIHLSDIGDDRQWHYFELEIDVSKSAAPGRQFMIRRVLITNMVDGERRVHILTLNVPMWKEVKSAGYSTGMQIFLETQNMNTNCSEEHVFKGASLWDSLSIVRYTLGEAPEEPQKTVSN